MGEPALKPGWRWVKFGDVVHQVKDKVDPASAGLKWYVAGEHMDTDDLRIQRRGEIGDNYLGPAFHMRFIPGQVLYGSRRTYLRKVARADFEGICANTTFVLESKDESVLVPDLLPFLMQTESFHEHSVKQSKGSVNPYVNFSDLAWYEFPLPPLKHQKRAVGLMAAIDRECAALMAAKTSLSRVRSAFAEDFFAHASNIGPMIRLEDGCLRITDGTHQPPRFTSEGVPFFLVKTISSGSIDWSTTKFVSKATYAELTKRVRPQRGDVLYTAVGATYGVALLVDFDDPFVFQRHIAHIIPNTDIFDGKYIEIFLNSTVGKRQSDQAAIGSAQPTVTLRSLCNFDIPRPDLDTQSFFVDQISGFDRRIANLEDRTQSALGMRAAALREVFE
ncbi:MAG: restriction endonuclease subunit S [Proteobacteria bacterium]|nr:restriction endonuclease subunit S [Pseudomonadota bacterium]